MSKIPLINPNNNLKLIWDLIHMLVIIMYLFLLPLHIAY